MNEMIPAPDGKGGFLPLDPRLQQLGEIMMDNTGPLAFPVGTRVMKRNSGKDDRTQDGSIGTVKGSHTAPHDIIVDGIHVINAYIVAWDDCPEQPVFMIDHKVKRA